MGDRAAVVPPAIRGAAPTPAIVGAGAGIPIPAVIILLLLILAVHPAPTAVVTGPVGVMGVRQDIARLVTLEVVLIPAIMGVGVIIPTPVPHPLVILRVRLGLITIVIGATRVMGDIRGVVLPGIRGVAVIIATMVHGNIVPIPALPVLLIHPVRLGLITIVIGATRVMGDIRGVVLLGIRGAAVIIATMVRGSIVLILAQLVIPAVRAPRPAIAV